MVSGHSTPPGPRFEDPAPLATGGLAEKCLVAVPFSETNHFAHKKKKWFFLPKNGHEELSSNPSIVSSFDPRVDGGVKGEEIGEEAPWLLVQIHNMFRSSKVF